MAQSLLTRQKPAFALRSPSEWAAVLCVVTLIGGCAGPRLWEQENPSHSTESLALSDPAFQNENPLVGVSVLGQSSLELEQVRCRAATSAILGQLTEMELGLAAEFYGESPCLTPNAKSLQQELLMLRGAVRGNEAAASALEIFLQLAEAESQLPLIDASLREILSMQADLEELKTHNLPVEEEPDPLKRQELSARERREALEAGIAQGWANLRVLLDEEGPASTRPNLEMDSLPPLTVPDHSSAVQVAMEMHPELRTLRTTIQRLTPETLPMARLVLQQYEGSLGTVQPIGIGLKIQQALGWIPWFGPNQCPLPSQVREMEIRTIQLAELLRKREQAVAAEVDAALISWTSALDRWESIRKRVLSWEEQLERLTEKQPVDDTITSFDLAKARLGILEAKSELQKVAFECHQARADLWSAQGVAGAGCGLPGHDPFWCENCQSTHGQFQSEPTSDDLPAPFPELLPQAGTRKPPLNP